MYEVRTLDERDGGRWDALVQEAPEGHIFQTSAWTGLCERTQPARLVRLGFFERGRLVAVLPLFLSRMGPFKIACSPHLLGPPMGPALSRRASAERFWDSLDTYLAERGVNFTRLFLPTHPDEAPFLRRGYTCLAKPTHLLDLTVGEEALWQGMKGTARTALRKAERCGVEVEFREAAGHLDWYYDLAREVWARHGKPVAYPKDFNEGLFSGPLARHARLVVASRKGRDIAAAVILHYKDSAYYLDGVSEWAQTCCRPNEAVQWFAIRWAAGAGLRRYDFIRSDFPWLAAFKAKFGGRLHDYLLLEKARPRYLFPLRTLYGKKLKPWCRALQGMLKGVL
jgi:lipid II:glycine glycyltransferase (peptidoglycan interpeptide bridge formation enzyme)